MDHPTHNEAEEKLVRLPLIALNRIDFKGMWRLRIAAGLGIFISVAAIITAIQDPNGFDYPPLWYAYLSLALAFYSLLAIVGLVVHHSRLKRSCLKTFAGISLAIGLASGGAGGFIVFLPSSAMLLWLAVKP